MAANDSEKFRDGNFEHSQNLSGAFKKLDGWPLCYQLAYVRQTVVGGQGHFTKHLLPCPIPLVV